MAEVIIEYGHPRNGATAERPTNAPPGFLYFDESIGVQLVWNSVSEQWESASIGYGTTAARPDADAVPKGTLYFNDTTGALEVSDGSSWLELAVTDNQSSSSTSSTNSSSSTSSSTSSNSSSTSSSSSSSSHSSSSS